MHTQGSRCAPFAVFDAHPGACWPPLPSAVRVLSAGDAYGDFTLSALAPVVAALPGGGGADWALLGETSKFTPVSRQRVVSIVATASMVRAARAPRTCTWSLVAPDVSAVHILCVHLSVWGTLPSPTPLPLCVFCMFLTFTYCLSVPLSCVHTRSST